MQGRPFYYLVIHSGRFLQVYPANHESLTDMMNDERLREFNRLAMRRAVDEVENVVDPETRLLRYHYLVKEFKRTRDIEPEYVDNSVRTLNERIKTIYQAKLLRLRVSTDKIDPLEDQVANLRTELERNIQLYEDEPGTIAHWFNERIRSELDLREGRYRLSDDRPRDPLRLDEQPKLEVNHQSPDPIQWLGSYSQLDLLFQKLINAGFLEGTVLPDLEAVLVSHFVGKRGDPLTEVTYRDDQPILWKRANTELIYLFEKLKNVDLLDINLPISETLAGHFLNKKGEALDTRKLKKSINDMDNHRKVRGQDTVDQIDEETKDSE